MEKNPIIVSDPKFKSPAEIAAMSLTVEQWNQLYALEVAGLNRLHVVAFLAAKRVNPAAEVFMGEEVTAGEEFELKNGEVIQEPDWRDKPNKWRPSWPDEEESTAEEETGEEEEITEPEKPAKQGRRKGK